MNLVKCTCNAVCSLAILIIFQPNIFADGKFSIAEEDKNYWAFQPVDESIHKDSSIDIIVNNAIKKNELEPNGEASREVRLGQGANEEFQAVVEGGLWQEATALPGPAGYALVGCVVAPGFDFEDFEMHQS